MRSLLVTFVLLAFATSCSNSELDQAASSQSVGSQGDDSTSETSSADIATVEEPKESSPVEIKLIERDSPLVVGDQAPNFRLQDQAGEYQTLDGLLAKGNVALVFYRSADW